jgi:hypothetical protein
MDLLIAVRLTAKEFLGLIRERVCVTQKKGFLLPFLKKETK